MADIIKSNGFLVDENGQVMEIVDRHAREEVTKLSREIEGLKRGDETEVTTETPVDFSTSKYGYVHKNGSYVDSYASSNITYFKCTEPIFLKKGDRIDISVKG